VEEAAANVDMRPAFVPGAPPARSDEGAAQALSTVITEHSLALTPPSAAARRTPRLRWAAACAVPLLVFGGVYAAAEHTAAVPRVHALKAACGALQSRLDAFIRGAPALHEPRLQPASTPVVLQPTASGSVPPRVRPPRKAPTKATRPLPPPVQDARSANDALAAQLDRRR
jgi:hypothetical protein